LLAALHLLVCLHWPCLDDGSTDVITDREKRLLRRMAQGKTDHAIAAEIGGTDKQITKQRLALLRKLGIESDAQLRAAAAELAAWPAKMREKTAIGTPGRSFT
jgi:DNA-binding CsgD family transcriptional regulator